MKKILLSFLALSILSLSLISGATQTITIDDTGYKPSLLFPTVLYGTGSQVSANITVTNDAGWNYIKRVNLEWEGSSVGCNLKDYADDWRKYQCVLTVTPTMDHATNVYITSTDYDGEYSVLWDNFAFAGQSLPPVPTRPQKEWKVTMKTTEDGFAHIDGDDIHDEIKVSGNIFLKSSTLSDVSGSLSVTVKENKKTKLTIKFKPTYIIDANPDVLGSYYAFGIADVYVYREAEYLLSNGRIRTKWVKEKLDDIPMQVTFNPSDSNFEIMTTYPYHISARTDIDKMRFIDY